MWQAACFCFILAGLTGTMYRFGMIGWLPQDLSLQNIRHAHSHLMFFGWAVPLPLFILLHRVAGQVGTGDKAVQLMRWSVWGGISFGVLSYPFFLSHGYHPVEIGSMLFPLSVIFSGLVMISWYGYMSGYLMIRSRLKPDATTPWHEASLVMLFISSLGAWGVAMIQFLGLQDPLFGKALTHFFLATFTEGWVILVLLGLLYDALGIDIEKVPVSSGLLIGCILFGAPLTFPNGISAGLITVPLMLAARVGGLLVAAGLGLNLLVLFRRLDPQVSWYWKIPLLLLGLKTLVQLLVSILPVEPWMSNHGFRILYLHLLLLGAFSLGLFTTLHKHFNIWGGLNFIMGSILLVLLSLVLLTPLWPQAWLTPWQFYVVAAVAALPAVAAGYDWFKLRIKA